MRKTMISTAALFALFSIVACSSNPAAPAGEQSAAPKKTEAPQYETGRNAFQKLFVAARAVAPDAKPYKLVSAYTPGAPVSEGKAGIWRAEFASPSKRAIKAYTWSGVAEEGSPDRGVTHGTEDSYNPSNSSTQIFEIAFLKIDSDKAFEVAQKHGGEKLMKSDPKQPVIYLLDFNTRANELIWHVIYGENRNDAKLKVAVNATTGGFMRIEH